MRILYLCHRIPYPPDKGDKIRAFHQIRALAAHHEVDVFTLADDTGDLVHRDALGDYCHQLTVARVRPLLARFRALPYLLTHQPLTLPYFYSEELRAEVRKALRSRTYDRIFVYCSAMAQYVDSVDDIPVITDFVDADSDKWMQYASFTRFPYSAVYRREGRALREYERKVCEKSDAVVVTTEREAQLIRQISIRAAIHVISNGVDTAYFDPAAVPKEPGAPAVIFTGDMSYFPNATAVIYFARYVLPLIRESVPDVRFLIVGRNPGKKVQELQKIEGVQVTGFVPDVRTWLAKAQVAVAPFTIAAGIQNKILEAMAFGLPVVATSRTGQGLSSEIAEIVEIADGPKDLAAKVLMFLHDRELAVKTGVEGRRAVAAAYRWDQFAAETLALLGPESTREPGIAAGRTVTTFGSLS